MTNWDNAEIFQLLNELKTCGWHPYTQPRDLANPAFDEIYERCYVFVPISKLD